MNSLTASIHLVFSRTSRQESREDSAMSLAVKGPWAASDSEETQRSTALVEGGSRQKPGQGLISSLSCLAEKLKDITCLPTHPGRFLGILQSCSPSLVWRVTGLFCSGLHCPASSQGLSGPRRAPPQSLCVSWPCLQHHKAKDAARLVLMARSLVQTP